MKWIVLKVLYITQGDEAAVFEENHCHGTCICN